MDGRVLEAYLPGQTVQQVGSASTAQTAIILYLLHPFIFQIMEIMARI